MSEHDHQVAFFSVGQPPAFPRHRAAALHAERWPQAPDGGWQVEGRGGMPDVSWPVVRGGFIGLAIEFKFADGNPSKEQRARIDQLQREGWLVAVCWSWEAAARMLAGYAGMLCMGKMT